MLLLVNSLDDNDTGTINIALIARLFSKDWGLWRTTTMDLDNVKELSQNYESYVRLP